MASYAFCMHVRYQAQIINVHRAVCTAIYASDGRAMVLRMVVVHLTLTSASIILPIRIAGVAAAEIECRLHGR